MGTGRLTPLLGLRLLLAAAATAALLAGCSAPSAPSPSPPPNSSGASTVPAPSSNEAGAYPDPLPLTGEIDAVHDPAMVKTPDGTYLLVSTGENLAIRTSTDRTSWTREGSVWPDDAPWTEPYTSPTDRSALWAPDISYHDGTYYLYYAASSFGSRTSAIFLATSTTGREGSWTNRGLVVKTGDDDEYNAIDPNLVVDEQRLVAQLRLVLVGPEAGRARPGHRQAQEQGLRAGRPVHPPAQRRRRRGGALHRPP